MDRVIVTQSCVIARFDRYIDKITTIYYIPKEMSNIRVAVEEARTVLYDRLLRFVLRDRDTRGSDKCKMVLFDPFQLCKTKRKEEA